MFRSWPGIVLALIGCTAGSSLLSAQCAVSWVSTGGFPGVNGNVSASTMYDPDGAGPAPARLVIGGAFSAVGSLPIAGLAAWDPASGSWSSLGSMTGGCVALATLPNGDLVAAGGLPSALGGAPIGRWNGVAWSPLGSGFGAPGYPGGIAALSVLPNGDLIAAGAFARVGGMPASNIARWDGTAWLPLGSGLNAQVRALTTLANGDVVASGPFTVAGGVVVNGIARWDGSAWSALGSGMAGTPGVLAALPNGDLLTAWTVTSGPYTVPITSLGRWNGIAWSQVGPNPIGGWVNAIAAWSDVDFVMASGHNVFGAAVNSCDRWNGAVWSPLGSSPNGPVRTFARLPNGDIVAGGWFGAAGGTAAYGVARWNGAAWLSMGVAGMVGYGALAALPNGDLVAGGSSVVRWNGSSWSPLGGSFTSPISAYISALAAMPNGDVVAGGSFNSAGGVPVNNIARWNGMTWMPMGSGMNGYVTALASLPNGNLVAGGDFTTAGGVVVNSVARWNGTAWSPLASGVWGGPVAGQVHALAVMPNGDLIAGGNFDWAGASATNFIARWNGTTWFPLGAGISNPVGALAVLPNGNLVAGGNFLTAGGLVANSIARWNGVAWSALGGGVTGSVLALAPLPNGDVIAGGDFLVAGGLAANRVARWSGTGWSAVGAGADSVVFRFATMLDGDVFVGGHFGFVGGIVSPGIARLTTNCPASVTRLGAGCIGSGGPNVLKPTSLPWTGSTCTALTTGMPPSSLAVAVVGWTAIATPLAAILPQGAPGCSLLVSADVVTAVPTGTGTVSLALAIPNSVTLAGQTVHHQVVALEIVAGSIVSATSTNALALTIGSF